MKEIQNIVIIGCSGCGAIAARTLKKLKPSLNVTILREADEKGLLTRCATPYICCGDVMVDPSYKDDAIFVNDNIKLVNSAAVEIDREQKRVTTEDKQHFEYDKLVLATGAKAVVPPVPGIDLRGVFTLRKSGDAVNIQHWMNTERVRDAVLIGAGAIGVEVAYLTLRHGVGVHLAEMQEQILPSALDADMSSHVEAYLKQQGVDLRLGQRVEKITGNKDVESVVLSSGESIATQMVLLFVGVKPNTGLVEQANLDVGSHGVRVNTYLQTSDPDVYAGGDLVEYPCWVTGNPIVGQLRPNAVIAGRIIARNVLGWKMKYPALINGFATKFFDRTIAGTGITEAQAKEDGIEVVAVTQSSISQHSMMRERRPYTIKLIFEKHGHKLVGGQIVSESDCPVKHIDMLTVAMRGNLTAWDLAALRCAGQPELSPDPGMEPVALAADKACGLLGGNEA